MHVGVNKAVLIDIISVTGYSELETGIGWQGHKRRFKLNFEFGLMSSKKNLSPNPLLMYSANVKDSENANR